MKYYSTRDHKKERLYSLKEAAFMGLAPDGGLFMPEKVPQVNMDVVMKKASRSFEQLCVYLAEILMGDDVEKKDIEKVVNQALCFPVPLVHVGDDKYTLELFHGPTFAFKDVGAGFMGRMLGVLRNHDEELTILTATSGDTGSAVANGFYAVPGVKVVVLYPEGKVSDLQESQMTTLGGNIYPLRVRGNFDDCQRIVKEIFSDEDFRKKKNVTSANSINVLRWMPQCFYYFYGWYQWYTSTGKYMPEVVVPSGNYGNVAAGMLAKKMGLPIKNFVVASNANDVIPEFLLSGKYSPRPSVQTVANAMDVGSPSNYERIMDLYGGDFEVLKKDVSGFSCSDEQIMDAIREINEKYDYTSDPHSAVAYLATKQYKTDGFYLSTAHAAKFGDVIKKSVGKDVKMPDGLAKFLGKEKKFTTVNAESSDVEKYVMEI
ncbi:MAG: threonine synthase [Flavobacteriales bacterium]|nr:threonine synthase [Flavobacteriales bacterium]